MTPLLVSRVRFNLHSPLAFFVVHFNCFLQLWLSFKFQRFSIRFAERNSALWQISLKRTKDFFCKLVFQFTFNLWLPKKLSASINAKALFSYKYVIPWKLSYVPSCKSIRQVKGRRVERSNFLIKLWSTCSKLIRQLNIGQAISLWRVKKMPSQVNLSMPHQHDQIHQRIVYKIILRFDLFL